jgi:hypothetical protein
MKTYKMKSQTGRKIAKKITIFSLILCMIGMIIIFGMAVVESNIPKNDNLFLIPLSFLLFGIIGLVYSRIIMTPIEERERNLYKNKLRNYFNMGIDACLVGNYEKAAFIHNNFLLNPYDRRYLRGLFHGLKYHDMNADVSMSHTRDIIEGEKYEIK